MIHNKQQLNIKKIIKITQIIFLFFLYLISIKKVSAYDSGLIDYWNFDTASKPDYSIINNTAFTSTALNTFNSNKVWTGSYSVNPTNTQVTPAIATTTINNGLSLCYWWKGSSITTSRPRFALKKSNTWQYFNVTFNISTSAGIWNSYPQGVTSCSTSNNNTTMLYNDNQYGSINYHLICYVMTGQDFYAYVDADNSAPYNCHFDALPTYTDVSTLLFKEENGIGAYDDISIWNRALTVSDISAIYNYGKGIDTYLHTTNDHQIEITQPTNNEIVNFWNLTPVFKGNLYTQLATSTKIILLLTNPDISYFGFSNPAYISGTSPNQVFATSFGKAIPPDDNYTVVAMIIEPDQDCYDDTGRWIFPNCTVTTLATSSAVNFIVNASSTQAQWINNYNNLTSSIEINRIISTSTIRTSVCSQAEWDSTSTLIQFKCYAFMSAFDVASTIISWAKSVMDNVYLAFSSMFPFNMPAQVYLSWKASESQTLPANLSFLSSFFDVSNNLILNVDLSGTRQTFIIMPPIDDTDDSRLTSFFNLIKAFSTYFQYFIFIFAIYGFSKDVIKDLINIKKEDTLEI